MLRPKRFRPSHRNVAEDKTIKLIDQLSAFERFKAFMPPELCQALERGDTAEKILKKYTAFAAARQVADIVNPISKTGSKSARELLDRVYGRPTERTEVHNKFDQLNDDQLQSALSTKMRELEIMEADLAKDVTAPPALPPGDEDSGGKA